MKKMIKGRKLPSKAYKTNEKEYNELVKKDFFYVCLVTLSATKDRFKRCLKPTKIVDIKNDKLIPEKGKSFSYDSKIYYFDTYGKCAQHFNQQIDEQSVHVKKQVEKIKEKYEQMLKLKVNLRGLKLNRIVKPKQ